MRNGTSKSPFRLLLGDSLCAPVRPAPGSRYRHGARSTARCRASPWPLRGWLDGVSDALAYGLRGFGT